jgi:hypothetical protein
MERRMGKSFGSKDVTALPLPPETDEAYLLQQREKALSDLQEAEESQDRDGLAEARERVRAVQLRMRKLGFD